MLFDELILVFDLELCYEVLKVMQDFVIEGMMMIVVMYEIGFVKWVGMWLLFMDQGGIVEDGYLVDLIDWLLMLCLKEFLKYVF